MQTPSKACRRSFSPSFTRTFTRTVSPARNGGISERSHSFCVSANSCIYTDLIFFVDRLGNLTLIPFPRKPLPLLLAPFGYLGVVTGEENIGDLVAPVLGGA